MIGNAYRLRTELWIEDVNVGSWSDLNYNVDKSRLAVECNISLPIYGIGTAENREWVTADRVRQVYKDVSFRRGSLVRAYCWYEQPEEWGNTFERKLVFKGFIAKPIRNGFPVNIVCEGLSYIFRFGRVDQKGKQNMKFEEVIEKSIPVCLEAFKEFRRQQDLAETIDGEDNFLNLRWSQEGVNVQATSSPVAYNPYNQVTPFNMIEQLMRSFNLYCCVLDDWTVHFGMRLIDNAAATAELSTSVNVLDANIRTDDGAFVDYTIRLTGIGQNGQRIAVEYETNNNFAATSKEGLVQTYIGQAGYRTRGNRSSINGEVSTSSGTRPSPKDNEWGNNRKNPLKGNVEIVERASTYATEEGIKQDALSIANSLRGLRHRGKIKLMLYPFLRIFDFVQFESTQFPNLNDGYYITGYTFSCTPKEGARQVIDVTNQKWLV